MFSAYNLRGHSFQLQLQLQLQQIRALQIRIYLLLLRATRRDASDELLCFEGEQSRAEQREVEALSGAEQQ